jgi:transposase
MDILKLYARKYNRREPVIGVDEKTVQILSHLRNPLPLVKEHGIRVDFHYKRNGVANIFVAVESKGGRRFTQVTDRKTRVDFLAFLQSLVKQYPRAIYIHIVLDNFGTHSEKKLRELAGNDPALDKIVFHFTPVHASWLNVAELEIDVLQRQCLKEKRFGCKDDLKIHVQAWDSRRNQLKVKIIWKFTQQKAKQKFKLDGLQILESKH